MTRNKQLIVRRAVPLNLNCLLPHDPKTQFPKCQSSLLFSEFLLFCSCISNQSHCRYYQLYFSMDQSLYALTARRKPGVKPVVATSRREDGTKSNSVNKPQSNASIKPKSRAQAAVGDENAPHIIVEKDVVQGPPSRNHWVPDSHTNSCICGVRFSVFSRRHHCRRCVVWLAHFHHRLIANQFLDVGKYFVVIAVPYVNHSHSSVTYML